MWFILHYAAMLLWDFPSILALDGSTRFMKLDIAPTWIMFIPTVEVALVYICGHMESSPAQLWSLIRYQYLHS